MLRAASRAAAAAVETEDHLVTFECFACKKPIRGVAHAPGEPKLHACRTCKDKKDVLLMHFDSRDVSGCSDYPFVEFLAAVTHANDNKRASSQMYVLDASLTGVKYSTAKINQWFASVLGYEMATTVKKGSDLRWQRMMHILSMDETGAVSHGGHVNNSREGDTLSSINRMLATCRRLHLPLATAGGAGGPGGAGRVEIPRARATRPAGERGAARRDKREIEDEYVSGDDAAAMTSAARRSEPAAARLSEPAAARRHAHAARRYRQERSYEPDSTSGSEQEPRRVLPRAVKRGRSYYESEDTRVYNGNNGAIPADLGHTNGGNSGDSSDDSDSDDSEAQSKDSSMNGDEGAEAGDAEMDVAGADEEGAEARAKEGAEARAKAAIAVFEARARAAIEARHAAKEANAVVEARAKAANAVVEARAKASKPSIFLGWCFDFASPPPRVPAKQAKVEYAISGLTEAGFESRDYSPLSAARVVA